MTAGMRCFLKWKLIENEFRLKEIGIYWLFPLTRGEEHGMILNK